MTHPEVKIPSYIGQSITSAFVFIMGITMKGNDNFFYRHCDLVVAKHFFFVIFFLLSKKTSSFNLKLHLTFYLLIPDYKGFVET